MKEAAWVGRAGGMDSFGMSLDEEGMRRRKHGELPPLSADGAEGSVAVRALRSSNINTELK